VQLGEVDSAHAGPYTVEGIHPRHRELPDPKAAIFYELIGRSRHEHVTGVTVRAGSEDIRHGATYRARRHRYVGRIVERHIHRIGRCVGPENIMAFLVTVTSSCSKLSPPPLLRRTTIVCVIGCVVVYVTVSALVTP